MNLLRLAVRFIDKLNSTVGRLTALSLLPLVALVSYEVFLRYVMRTPTTWGMEVVSFIFAGYIMLGGGYTLLHRDHVAMDILYSRWSPRTQAIVDTATAGFVILFCWVLFEQTYIMTTEAYQSGQRTASDWSPLLFPALLAFPIGAFLILLQACAQLARNLYMAITGTPLLPDVTPRDEPEVLP